MAVKDHTSGFEPKAFGRYVLMDKLAIGGMAEIYKAKTYGVDGFEKLLAIKRILPHCSADKEFINMLVDEAKLTVLLSHANIVQVFDLGKVGDDYFISMEFINGTNLREVMNRYQTKKEKMSEEIAVYIMSEVCKGLDYAHRKTDSQGNPLNIVHRDISPQNILLSYEGEVKIVDFGIAKAAMNVSHTMAGILKGKIAYMSPEQALGKPIDHRTDIFSAGVVLYELLTGEKLFTGETQFEVLNQIRTTRVNTLMLPDYISGPLKAILAKALAYNAKDRYQSAGDFQLDLTKYLYSSYIDFSPRHLSAILNEFFQKEIKKREAPITLNEHTRSVMVNQSKLENIVVHGAPKVASASPPKDQTVSGLYGPLLMMKARQKWVKITGGVVAGLVLLSLGYFFMTRSKTPPPPPAVTETKTKPSEQPATDLGSLQIQTNPSGARIFVNGNDTGLSTPASVPKLAEGEEYQVRVEKENYKPVSKTVAVTSAEPVKIEENLEPLPNGSIEVESNPSGARIMVDNRDTGHMTPYRVDGLEIQKSYNVKLSLPNYYEWSASAEVKDFDPVKLQAALTPAAPAPVAPPVQTPPVTPTPAPTPAPAATKTSPKIPPKISKTQPAKKPVEKPKEATKPAPTPAPVEEERISGNPGTITVSSSPSGAEVYINGELKGTTPARVSGVGPGTVKLTLSKEGAMRYTASVRVNPGENKSLGTIELGNPYGEVSIRSMPPRAEVIFDGEAIGARTPVTIRRVPRDRAHTLQLKLDGYRTWETSVNLSGDTTKKYDVQLERN
jgi:serine/threonine protein kinase